MKRLIVIAGLPSSLAVLARLAQRRLPALMKHMMEHVMPGMMDHCFSRMDREWQEFMLAHCRGMLDQMEAKYLKGEQDDVSDSPAESVARPV